MTLTTAYTALKTNLAHLAEWTQDQLTDLATAVAAGFYVEHDAEGHHTTVTATSLAAPRHRFSGVAVMPLRYAEASSYALLGSGLHRPMFNRVQVPSNVGIVLFEPDDSASADPAVDGGYEIGSLILPTAPKSGDMILVGHSPQTAFPVQLRSLFASGDANYRFYIPPLQQNVDYSGAFTLGGAPGLVPLIYLEAPYAYRGTSGTASVFGAWTLLSTLSYRTSPL